MQCCYRETLVPTRDLATKQRQAQGIFYSTISSVTQSMTSARVMLTNFESAVFDEGENSLTQELVFTVSSIPRCVRDDSHNDIIPNAMRNGKTVVTNFTKCVIVAF